MRFCTLFGRQFHAAQMVHLFNYRPAHRDWNQTLEITMMNRKNALNIAVGGAFIAACGVATVSSAAQNPFAMQTLEKGYITADAQMAKDGKAMEGSCGSTKKSADAKESPNKKAMSGEHSPDKKTNKVMEAKCGGAM
jgi:uncharacterized low-complexity protein